MPFVKSWLAYSKRGYRYAVLDAPTEHHLEIQGEALRDAPLVTGGSGLAIGLARQWAQENGNRGSQSRASARWARRSALRFMLSNDQPPGSTLPSNCTSP